MRRRRGSIARLYREVFREPAGVTDNSPKDGFGRPLDDGDDDRHRQGGKTEDPLSR